MKKLAILSAIALSGLIFSTADAQVKLHVGLSLGPVSVVYNQPVTVAQSVYDDSNDDDYYYLPDVDAYYDVTAGCYYYNNGYNWVSAAYLPGSYRNYDWRSARRYEIHEHRPFVHNEIYRSRYNGREVAEWKNHNNDNRNGYGQSSNRGHNQNQDNHGGYGQPNRNNGNHGQGGYGQPNQNNGGSGSHGRGSDEHFAGNRPATMGMSHRPARF